MSTSKKQQKKRKREKAVAVTADDYAGVLQELGPNVESDLPLTFHPAAIRASAVVLRP